MHYIETDYKTQPVIALARYLRSFAYSAQKLYLSDFHVVEVSFIKK